MTISAEFLLQIVIALGSGFGCYAAIRADLATLHERTKHTKERADEAHARLDKLHT